MQFFVWYFQSLTMQFFNNVLKKIAQTMRINNVFATNSKMQRKKANISLSISVFQNVVCYAVDSQIAESNWFTEWLSMAQFEGILYLILVQFIWMRLNPNECHQFGLCSKYTLCALAPSNITTHCNGVARWSISRFNNILRDWCDGIDGRDEKRNRVSRNERMTT